MALQVPDIRPAVLKPETAQALAPYLRFRHLVRNLYTWSFDAEKLADLIAGLSQVTADLDADLREFGRFLRAAGFADEIDVGGP